MRNNLIFHIVIRLVCVIATIALAVALPRLFFWAEYSPVSAHARYASVHFSALFPAFTRSLSNAGQYFNIPLFSIIVWVAWFVGIMREGMTIGFLFLPQRVTILERISFAFATGFVEIGILLYMFLLFGWSTPICISIVLCLFLLSLILPIPQPYNNLFIYLALSAKRIWKKDFSRCSKTVTVAAVVLVILGFAYCLTPPIQSDAMRYHLVAPQEFLKSGGIHELPLNAFSNFPLLTQSHYAIALTLHCPEAAHLMHFTCLIFLALGLASLVYRFAPTADEKDRMNLAAMAACLYLASPAAFLVGCWPFVDQATCLLIFMSVFALILYFELGRQHAISPFKRVFSFVKPSAQGQQIRPVLPFALAIFAGYFAGGAVGTKYTAGPFLAVSAVLICAFYVRKAGFLRSFKALVFFSGTAFLIGQIFYLMNLFRFGNPLYPFGPLPNINGDWTAENAAFYAQRMADKGNEHTLFNFLTSFWDCFTFGLYYEAHYPGPVFIAVFLMTSAFLGAILLLFVHERFVKSINPPFSQIPLFFLCFSLGFLWWIQWFFTYQSNRQNTLSFAFFIPCAMSFLALQSRFTNKYWSAVARWVCAVFAIYSMCWSASWILAKAEPSVVRYLSGGMNREEYMTRHLSYWPAFQYLNDRTDSTTKVFVIGDFRLYGANFQAFWADWFNTPAPAHYMRTNTLVGPDAFFKKVIEDGFSWIFINNGEMAAQGPFYSGRMSAEEWKTVKALPTAAEAAGYEIIRVPKDLLLIKLPKKQTNTTGTLAASN